MFTDEERNKLLEDSRSSLMAQGTPDVPGPLWRALVERVHAKLHVVLCMSPVGETFRLRCRQLPSLVNCCTINWFSDWPPEALTYACTPLHSPASPLHPLACTIMRHSSLMLCAPCHDSLHSSVLCIVISTRPILLQLAAVLMDLGLRLSACTFLPPLPFLTDTEAAMMHTTEEMQQHLCC